MLLWSPPCRVRPVGFAIDLHGLAGLFVPLAPLASVGVWYRVPGPPDSLNDFLLGRGQFVRPLRRKRVTSAADARPRLCYIRDDRKVAAGKPRGAFGTRSFSILRRLPIPRAGARTPARGVGRGRR